MRNQRRSPHQRRPILEPLEGRELLSRLADPVALSARLPAVKQSERKGIVPPTTRNPSLLLVDDDRSDPNDPQDPPNEEAVAGLATDSELGAARRPTSSLSSSWSARASPPLTVPGLLSHDAIATSELPAVSMASLPMPTISPLAVVEARPMEALSSGMLPSPVTPSLDFSVSRGAWGCPIVGAPDGRAAVSPSPGMPETREGDRSGEPPLRGDGPIAGVFPFDGSAIDRAVDRFFAHLEDLDAQQPATLGLVSTTLAVVAVAVALVVIRRRFRSRTRVGEGHGDGDGNGDGDDAPAGGSVFANGLPVWPGSWSVSPR